VIGGLRLIDVAPTHIEQFLRDKRCQKLSSKSVRNVLVLIQGIFSLAVDNDLIVSKSLREILVLNCVIL